MSMGAPPTLEVSGLHRLDCRPVGRVDDVLVVHLDEVRAEAHGKLQIRGQRADTGGTDGSKHLIPEAVRRGVDDRLGPYRPRRERTQALVLRGDMGSLDVV